MSVTKGWPAILVVASMLISACVLVDDGGGAGADAIALDNSFVQALAACDPAVQAVKAFNESFPSTVTNIQEACEWPDRAEPVFGKMHDCFAALPQPNDSNLKAARADLLESNAAYDKVIDLMRHFCTDEANPADISDWARKASAAFDSAMAHMAAYNQSIE